MLNGARQASTLCFSAVTLDWRVVALTTFTYELGDAHAPRGHALLVFHPRQGGPGVWVTYLVIPPVTMDFTKYLPPMLASFAPVAAQMGGSSAVPMPPMPEQLESMAAVRRLAVARGDDLLDAGSIDVAAIDQLMLATAEAAQRYHDAYTSYVRTVPEAPALEVRQASALDEDEVLYQALSESERLGELSKLVGKLRYAIDGKDDRLAAEAKRQIQALGRVLPAKYRVDDLLTAASGGPNADRLAALYVERCFKLYREEYELLPDLEAQIQELHGR